MPVTPKAHRFMELCSTARGQTKAKGKCPPLKTARELAKSGIKTASTKVIRHKD